MSVAIMQALALARQPASRRCLSMACGSRTSPRPRRIVDEPWTIAAGADFAFRGVAGTRPAGVNVDQPATCRSSTVAASIDRVVCQRFFEVANLLAPASTLLHPAMLARSRARACCRRRSGAAPPGATRSAAR